MPRGGSKSAKSRWWFRERATGDRQSLSVEWSGELASHGWSAVHWSIVGDPGAEDTEIMGWALANGYVIFSHNLDFGTMLALTGASGPSVLQVRGQAVLPEDIGPVVASALRQYEAALETGTLFVVELRKSRVRVLSF